MATKNRYLIAGCDVRRYYNSSGTWIQDYQTNLSATLTMSRTVTSVDTGKFQPGVYRVNPYSIADEEYELGDRTYAQVISANNQYRYTWNGDLIGQAITTIKDVTVPTYSTSLKQEALLKAYAKLGAGDLLLSADLGEIRETIEMLKRPTVALRNFMKRDGGANRKKLLRFLQALRKRSAGELSRDAFKEVSKAWLEYRYGWSPLIRTLAEVLKELEEKQGSIFDPLKIRSVRAKVVKTASYTKIDTMCYTGFNSVTGCSREFVDEVTGTASVQYRQSKPLATDVKLGLSPRFIPELVWELTKLSFVWDWLFTIGPWIQSFRYKPEITVLGSTEGVKLKRDSTLKLGYYGGKIMPGGPGKWRYRSYSRAVSTYRPLYPVFRAGDVMDLKRSCDAVALILQRALRGR